MSSVVIPGSVKESAPESAEVSTCRLQHLPCRVQHRGPAQVDVYFTPLVEETASGVLEGQFRGRPLDGSTVTLPAGYTGVVAKTTETDAGTKYEATELFRRYTRWNWDRKPSPNDAAARLQDWLDVAEAIHSISDDEKDN